MINALFGLRVVGFGVFDCCLVLWIVLVCDLLVVSSCGLIVLWVV